MMLIPKPPETEYAPYTAGYVGFVPDDGRVLEHLQTNLEAVQTLVRSFAEPKLSTPCAAGEWTVKEILIHVSDSERVFAYRTLRFARGDTTPLPGFNQNDYVPASRANQRDLEDILAEYRAVRLASLALFNSLDEAALLQTGAASGYPMSVRAAVYIIAGHELHHLHSIRQNYG